MTASPAVEVDDLRMAYGATTAVDGLSLTVARGSITAVLGPNGAGKTTTLETCEGYRKPQGGRVRVLGLDPQTQRRDLLPRIGVMLQSGGAWSGVRAVEMLRHVATLHAHPLDVPMLVARLGLESCGRTPFRRLSGGQQQRLADQVHVIDHGRLIASGSPYELTRGTGSSTIRLVLSEPFPPEAPASLQATLGAGTEVRPVTAHSLLITGPADASTLAKVSAWCDEQGVLPESLTLGQRTLEDVFLQITGRELVP